MIGTQATADPRQELDQLQKKIEHLFVELEAMEMRSDSCLRKTTQISKAERLRDELELAEAREGELLAIIRSGNLGR